MTNEKDLKITCGLEIHQQLSGKKLFCNCPTKLREDDPDYQINRRLRAVVGETGVIDEAAAREALKKKTYIYNCFDDCCCLVDLDEAPPNKMNEDVLHTAVQIGKLLNASFVDEVQVMRKTIVNGSIPSGFQRTSLIAFGGFIETSQGNVSIPTVLAEEDSGRIISSDKNSITFGLDRLGIPLLEISTGPDIHSPEQCAECAEKLGLFLRSSGKCRRGLGTIRQDVNVSIEGGERVEVKGAQDLRLLPTIVTLEAERQSKLLDIRDELKKRKLKFISPQILDVSHLFRNSKSKVILNSLKKGGVVLGIKLSCFKGLIGKSISINKRLGSEFSERAKVAASVGGIFHSDELPNYGIELADIDKLNKHFDCGSNDAFVLCADDSDRADSALRAVIERAGECLLGVPKEVRKSLPDGTTAYLRPIPGSARMYPETDVLPVKLDSSFIRSVKLPELIDSKIMRFKKLGLGSDLAELVAKSSDALLFDNAVKKFKNLKPAFIAEVIMTSARSIRTQFNIDIDPSDEDFLALFDALDKGILSKESILDVLKQKSPVKEVLKNFKTLSNKDVESEVKKIIKQNPNLSQKALMGVVMKELRSKASGKVISELVKKHVQ